MNINFIKKNLTIIVLCGGKGERLKPLTNNTPKPLIKINNETILFRILKHLICYRLNNFIIASGYKSNKIEKFIKNKKEFSRIKVLYTGENSDIISRIKKSLPFCKDNILICYGDTLLDININKLINFYLSNKNKIIVTAFNLKTNFGVLKILSSNTVVKFLEKPKLNLWINVGYILLNKKYYNLFYKFKTFKNFLINIGCKKKFKAFKHFGKHITINTLSELEEAKKNIKLLKNK